jgi:hypothetical protein
MFAISYFNHHWISTSELLSQLVVVIIQAITVIVVAVCLLTMFQHISKKLT